MTVHDLPPIEATLNGIATVLITAGFIFIKKGDPRAHRACMLSAAAASALFLVFYVTYHALMRGMHTPFGGAWARVTFPIWYYVSVTGVLVYFFLYRWWPYGG